MGVNLAIRFEQLAGHCGKASECGAQIVYRDVGRTGGTQIVVFGSLHGLPLVGEAII